MNFDDNYFLAVHKYSSIDTEIVPFHPETGFEVSLKFLQSFSESEILRKFHEIYDFSEIYVFKRHTAVTRTISLE